MEHKRRYLYPAALIFLSLLTSSWIDTHHPVSLVVTDGEIEIGNQVWMTHNLNVATFRNGDTIPHAKTKAEWHRASSKKQPAWCYYDDDSTNGSVYGKLYNWYAVNDQRGLAPVGWHIPSGLEWRKLYDFLGGKEGKVGRKLKSTAGWEEDGNGDNTVAFNAMPAGVRVGSLINPNNGFDGRVL